MTEAKKAVSERGEACLSCGKTGRLTMRREGLAVGGNAWIVGGVLAGFAGAALLRGAHVDSIALSVAVVAALVLLTRTNRLDISLPLCGECDRRWADGVFNRHVLRWLFGVGFALVAMAVLLDKVELLFVGGLLFVVGAVFGLVKGARRGVAHLDLRTFAVRIAEGRRDDA
jgi:hypothetical protein